MLDFWYSERCHRQVKLALCVAVCLLIYYCSKVAELSLLLSGLSLGLGALLHVLRQIKISLQQKKRYNGAFDAVLFILPLAYWLLLIFLLPPTHVWALMLQVIGFSILGLFVVSIYSNRARRFN